MAYAVTWEQPGGASATRHAIADRAVAHAVTRHLGPEAQVSGHADLLDEALTQKGTPPDALAGAHRCGTCHLRCSAHCMQAIRYGVASAVHRERVYLECTSICIRPVRGLGVGRALASCLLPGQRQCIQCY